MSHETNLIALNITFGKMPNAFISNGCVPSKRQIRTSTGFTYSEISIDISCNTAPRGWAFLMPLLCVGTSVQKCHRHVKIIDMSDERTDQSLRTTLFLLILVRSVLALSSYAWYCHWFWHKRHDNRPQHLIHVQLTDQMSLYNHQFCRPRF